MTGQWKGVIGGDRGHINNNDIEGHSRGDNQLRHARRPGETGSIVRCLARWDNHQIVAPGKLQGGYNIVTVFQYWDHTFTA